MDFATPLFRFPTTRMRRIARRGGRPRFSVIVNNYNYGRYLTEAIESIVAQTWRDYELIIVDDGSTDGSLDIIDRYEQASVVQTQRLNQARACLEAVRASRGDYIYFLDADDAALPGMLAEVAEHLPRQPSKVQFQLAVTEKDGRPTGLIVPTYPDGFATQHMRDDVQTSGMYVTPQTSGNVFSRQIFDHIEDIPYEKAIDGITLLVAPFIGEVVTIPRPLARYRLHGRSHAHTPRRYAEERRRYIGRLHHLRAILARQNIPFRLPREPEEMLFVADRRLMQTLSTGRRPSARQAQAFLQAAFRDRRLDSALKLTLWLIGAGYGPPHVRALLTEVHGNTQSPLRDVRNLTRAMLRGRHPTPRE